mgnify:CR=1 FL=1
MSVFSQIKSTLTRRRFKQADSRLKGKVAHDFVDIDQARRVGLIINAQLVSEADLKRLKQYITKLKQAGIDILYVGGYHTEAGLMVRQMRDQGMKTVLMSGDALVTDEYWSITGDAGEGTLMTFSPDPRKNPGAENLVKTFRAKGVEPEGYVLYTYAAIQAWAQAAKAAGKTDYEPMVKALNSGKFQTVLGDLAFDGKGDVTLPGYVFYEWKKGKYDYLSK